MYSLYQMRYIANIVSESLLNVPDEFNIVNSIDNIIPDLPTLIIGWDIIKSLYPDTDIQSKQINDNIFWTFRKRERRDIHEADLSNFIQYSYEYMVKDVQYIYIDIVHFNINKIRKIIDKIKQSDKIISYQSPKMVYICLENLIFGVDLRIYNYLGLNIDKLITKIKHISIDFLTDDNIFIGYKAYIERLNNQIKYIPYLQRVYGKTSLTSQLHLSQ